MSRITEPDDLERPPEMDGIRPQHSAHGGRGEAVQKDLGSSLADAPQRSRTDEGCHGPLMLMLQVRRSGFLRRTSLLISTPGNWIFASWDPSQTQSKLKTVKECPLVPATKPPLPLRIVDGGPVYTVKKLLAVRKRGQGSQFLVDWEAYGPEEKSWIPASFIVDRSLIDNFYKGHPDQPGP
ncbi:hypothetical protein L3Q82_015690, partial [Scortum barcoo]